MGYDADGRRVRRKVSGKTKQEVRAKLKELHADLDAGGRSPTRYTVAQAVDEWLSQALPGLAPRTITLYRAAIAPVLAEIGTQELRKLTAADVRTALVRLSDRLSTRSLQIAHNCAAA